MSFKFGNIYLLVDPLFKFSLFKSFFICFNLRFKTFLTEFSARLLQGKSYSNLQGS